MRHSAEEIVALRHEYYLKLSALPESPVPQTVSSLFLRVPDTGDLHALAGLMLDAYRGTCDYAGESLEEAVTEVQDYLVGRRGGKPLLAGSRVCCVEDNLVSACLVAQGNEAQLPVIAYVMTAADWKGRGLGKQVLAAALAALQAERHAEVRAIITEGNIPSERLFSSVGFRRLHG